MKHLLFVYGTLKQGHGNHVVLGKDAKFIMNGICPGLEMRSNGGFPYAFPQKDSVIVGEVYEIDSLRNCDGLEGYPNHYDRSKFLIHSTDDDATCKAWVYHVDDTRRQRNLYRLVTSGVWT